MLLIVDILDIGGQLPSVLFRFSILFVSIIGLLGASYSSVKAKDFLFIASLIIFLFIYIYRLSENEINANIELRISYYEYMFYILFGILAPSLYFL